MNEVDLDFCISEIVLSTAKVTSSSVTGSILYDIDSILSNTSNSALPALTSPEAANYETSTVLMQNDSLSTKSFVEMISTELGESDIGTTFVDISTGSQTEMTTLTDIEQQLMKMQEIVKLQQQLKQRKKTQPLPLVTSVAIEATTLQQQFFSTADKFLSSAPTVTPYLANIEVTLKPMPKYTATSILTADDKSSKSEETSNNLSTSEFITTSQIGNKNLAMISVSTIPIDDQISFANTANLSTMLMDTSTSEQIESTVENTSTNGFSTEQTVSTALQSSTIPETQETSSKPDYLSTATEEKKETSSVTSVISALYDSTTMETSKTPTPLFTLGETAIQQSTAVSYAYTSTEATTTIVQTTSISVKSSSQTADSSMVHETTPTETPSTPFSTSTFVEIPSKESTYTATSSSLASIEITTIPQPTTALIRSTSHLPTSDLTTSSRTEYSSALSTTESSPSSTTNLQITSEVTVLTTSGKIDFVVAFI